MKCIERIRSDVAEYGWSVMKVSNDRGPDFAYSIGMYRTFGHPELLMFGLEIDTMHQLLNDAGEAVRSGARFQNGRETDVLLDGYSVIFRTVPEFQYPGHLGWATEYYGGEAFPALQIVYPDRTGAWPWQDGVDADFSSGQPVLADIGIPSWAR